MRILRRSSLGVVAALLCAMPVAPVAPATVAAASLVVATDPTPEAPRPLRLMAGVHTLYAVDAAGAVASVGTKTVRRPWLLTTNARRSVAGTGVFLRVASGSIAGAWVRESPLAAVPGNAGWTVLASGAVIRFAVDPATSRRPYIGYRFDSAGKLLGTKVATLRARSSAHASRTLVINGRQYTYVISGLFAGWWVPGDGATARGVTCRAGNRPASAAARVLTRVTTAPGEVALTFDMGGRLDPAKAILEYLLLEQVCATVFPTGAAAATPQGAAALAIVRAHPELFEVGNHTMNHCNLRDGGTGTACPATRPTATFVRKELTDAAAVIRSLTGQSPAPYWRPPYGAQDAALRQVAAAAGYPLTVMWAADTIDWRPVSSGGPAALDIAAKIRGVATGGIVLMHLGGWNTLDGLPYGIAGLRERSLAATSISGLLD
jgi:peptidoglycan/xylan/chitin deacetylase (PgdA/CDA1 family)